MSELTNPLLTNSGYLRINDIEFEMPPERLAIVKRDFSNQVATIRSQTSTIIKTGRQMITFVAELHFGTGYNALTGEEKNVTSWINQQLAPLLIQVRKCPFVSVENEKIRKEVLGLDPSYNDRVIAAVVKDIEIISSARSSENLKVSITMDYFNYTPFTPDFKYKEILSNGVVVPSKLPGAPFRDFYNNGTRDERGRYVNALSSTKNTGLTIIYKQYYTLSIEDKGLENFIRETTTEAEFNSDAVKTAYNTNSGEWQSLVPAEKKLAQSLEAIRRLGWEEETSPFARQQNTKLMYRYVKFEIDGDISLDSDRIVVESAVAGLSTITPNITLQGHVTPTTQFLGCSDARLTLQLFANAHLSGEKPVGTSRKLAQLQEILQHANNNAVKYHRESFNDGVFVRHPIAKLCKYKFYNREKNRIRVFNPATSQIDVEDINEFLFCHTEDISSETVPGHPFCSRVSISFLENYIKEESEPLPESGMGISNNEAGKNMVKKLAQRFGIKKQEGAFIISDSPIGSSREENAIAEKLLKYVNLINKIEFIVIAGILQPIKGKEFTSVSEMIDSPLIETKRFVFRDSLIANGLEGELSNPPLCYETFNEIVEDLIILIEKSENQKYADYNAEINVIRRINAVPSNSAYPDMMLPEGVSQPDFAWYNLSDQRDDEKENLMLTRKVAETRLDIGRQQAENFGSQLPADLAGSNYVPAKNYPAPSANPASRYPGGIKDLDIPELGTPFMQNLLDPEQQIVVMKKGIENLVFNTYSMRRAMPTMKLYFRDDLPVEQNPVFDKNPFWRNFSDVYDLNAIIDIRVAKSQDNPVDMMVIRMTNSRKDLMTKYFEIINKDFDTTAADLKTKRQEKKALTPEESLRLKNSLKSNQDAKVIREGTRIELRLGYENDPNDLSVEFAGRIMSASGSDIIEIVCQGNGVELIQEMKGVAGINEDDFKFKGETGQVITSLLAKSPEVASFGSMRTSTGIGEFLLFESFGGRSGLENIFTPPIYSSFERLGEKTAKYTDWAFLTTLIPVVNAASPLIISAAAVAGIAADAFNFVRTLLVGCPFTVYEQTIWDVLQELTMRHPGTICSVVPFGNRSTIFFGFPDQLYFYRPPSYSEKIQFQGATKREIVLRKSNNFRGGQFDRDTGGRSPANIILTSSTTRRDLIKNNSGFLARIGAESESVTREEVEKFNKSSSGKLSQDAMKPFITYHLITSAHDIVMNDMQASSEDVFNAIEIVYPESSSGGNFDGSKGFANYKSTDTIMADDDLVKSYIKKQTLVFHNAHTDPVEDMPEKYAITNLVRSIENAYKGKIIILGRPNIKPHDIVFIEDTYNKISGPVKVGAVTQVFSYKTGWVTEIHPKLIVAPTGSTLLENVIAMKQAAKRLFIKNWDISQSVFTDPLTRADRLNVGQLVRKYGTVGVREAAQSAFVYASASASVQSGKMAFEAAKNLKDASKFKKALTFTTRAARLPGIAFALDAVASTYISWSRTRQPIAYIPVIRGEKEWVMGLFGFEDNTEAEALKKIGSNFLANTENFLNRVTESFRD